MKRFIKYFIIIISSILLFLIVAPYIFQDKIAAVVKETANETIEGKLDYKNLNLSFFKHFPNLTISASDVFLSGTEQFKSKPLLQVKEVALGINLMSLLKEQIIVQKIFIEDGSIHVQVDKNGQANYNIYVSESTDTISEALDIRIAQIHLNKIHLIYDDQSIPLKINARDFNYTGKGDLTSEVFDLNSKITIKEMDLDFDAIERLLLGLPVIKDTIPMEVTTSEEWIKLYTIHSNGYSSTAIFNKINNMLIEYQAINVSQQRNLVAKYGDIRKIGEKQFAFDRWVNISQNNSSFEMESKISDIAILNELSFPFEISSSLKRIEY